MRRILCLGLLLCISPLWAGQVQNATHNPQAILQAIQQDKHKGRKIFQAFCSSCHALKPLIPLGAPRIGVAKEWQQRIKRGNKAMLQHLQQQFGAMPPRGGCFECSDEDLLAALRYMLPKKHQSMTAAN